MRNKKAQAAMEFLMTYGWAILAAIIAIGVLSYFYFSPGNLTTDAVFLNAPFTGIVGVATTSGLQIEMKNGPQSVNITSVAVDGCGTNSTPVVLASGAQAILPVNCTLVADSIFRGDITITYKSGTSTLEQISSGSITAKVR